MFTGIVEETGEVLSFKRGSEGAQLLVSAAGIGPKTEIGESVAVNGCCLTVARRDCDALTFDLLGETLARTNLGELKSGARVNLERALSASGRLGGHFVQGHIDCAAHVRAFEKRGADHRLEVELAAEFARYAVLKGSIAINGASLTIAELREASFVVWLIPHTFSATNLCEVKAGYAVNLEFDLLAKYVERLGAK
jgi:riboflavin synthase